MKTKTKVSGFGAKTQPRPEYQNYNVELKRRYLTDNSEVLLGTATIRVPKDLADPTGLTATKRECWDAFAQACCYCLICSQVGAEKGLNQVFLFDNKWNLLERLETNTWNEGGESPAYQEPMSDSNASIAWRAFQRCQVEVKWFDVPVVA